MTKLQELENQLYCLYIDYWEAVQDMREDHSYDLESTCFGCSFGDYMCLWVSEMWRILEYEIPQDIVFERWDWKSKTFMSPRIKENLKKIKEYNLISFFRYFENENT